MRAALWQRPGPLVERSVDPPADKNQRRHQNGEQDELRDEAHRQEVVHGSDDRRRGAEPNEKCAGRERLDRAENEPRDEPGERDQMGRLQEGVHRRLRAILLQEEAPPGGAFSDPCQGETGGVFVAPAFGTGPGGRGRAGGRGAATASAPMALAAIWLNPPSVPASELNSMGTITSF